VTRKRSLVSRLVSKEFLTRVGARANEDELFGRAAQLSYYFLLAIFPLLFFLITLFGYFSGEGSGLRRELISYLSSVVPSAAVRLITSTIDEVTTARGGGKLSFGLLAALWAASNGMNAIAQALVSIALTIAMAILIVSALLIVLYGWRLGHFLAVLIHFGDGFTQVWKILQYPIALAFVYLTFSLIYNFAPNLAARRREHRARGTAHSRWLSPGVLIGVTLWLLVSLGFRLYLHFFNSYSSTYGSLGALIILMLWFYLTGAAILIGGEINCELDVEIVASEKRSRK
jgi:membrane protein